MSICPSETKDGLNNLPILSKNRKTEEQLKLKINLKQTHDQKLAEGFELLTKNLPEVNDSERKIEDVFKKIRC